MLSVSREHHCKSQVETVQATNEPLFSLVFFGKPNAHSFSGVTKHEIEDGVIKQGKYINPESVKDIFTTKYKEKLSLQNPKIIAENSQLIAWVSPSRKADMWFRGIGKQEVARLKVHWCPLLFVAYKTGGLKVFALGSNATPHNDTIVYHAPLMNIGSNGSVCQGTAKLPKTIDSSTLDECEDSIYASNFTHVNHQHTLYMKDNKECSTPQQFKFWKGKAKSGKKVSVTELVKKSTLGALLKTF